MTSRIAVDRATYSASVVDNAMVVCNLDCQMIGQFASLTPKPIDSDHITFRSVKNDDDEEVGKEVVYEPLEVDPNLTRWSDFTTSPIPNAMTYFLPWM